MDSLYNEFKKIAEDNVSVALGWKENEKWQTINYQELLKKIDNLTQGLSQIGIGENSRAVVLSENRPEWLMTDLALNKLGAISVPVHVTCLVSLVEFIIKDSASEFLFVSQSLFDKHKILLERLDVKIILFGDKKEDNTVLFDEILFLDPEGLKVRPSGSKDGLASIIYTSGTTGNPKGVMLSNANFLSNVKAAKEMIEVRSCDRFLSFLPLSHVLERTAGQYVPITNGASIYYAESIKKLSDNLAEVKPTIIIGVPKIFEKIYEKIFSNLNSQNRVVRRFFFWSLKQKPGCLGRYLAQVIVYKKIKKVFGGRLRFAISGGASINERIIRFFKNIGLFIVEGYGLTETAPLISVNKLDNIKIGTVGQIVPDVEVQIAPDKEILVRGGNVMLGYLNNEEASREVITEDGWFSTGDLGHLDKENYLAIIGRKKDMIITSNGKNVAPEKIENIINLSPYIMQSLVVGHKRPFISALIIPDLEIIKKEKSNVNIDILVKEEIEHVNKLLEEYEHVKSYKIIDQPFTIESGQLTPTLKVRRKIIENSFSDLINSIY